MVLLHNFPVFTCVKPPKVAFLSRAVSEAIKLNVFHTMNFLLRHCEAIREKVRSGQLEIQGGVYDLNTGKAKSGDTQKWKMIGKLFFAGKKNTVEHFLLVWMVRKSYEQKL